MRVAVVGGTGELGHAIARRLVLAGHDVAVGSRRPDAAAQAAAELGPTVRHGVNAAVVRGADVIFVAVPYSAHSATLGEIAGSVGGAIVVDATVPLVPPRVMRVQLPAAGSAAVEARAHLGPNARVVSALHNVAAKKLAAGGAVDCDVLVFSDDLDARGQVITLVEEMGLRAFAGGALANSAAAEALTSILIYLNKTYRLEGAGIRFTGMSAAEEPG